MQSEEAMMRDQEERAQLERNMKERDAARTRQVCVMIIKLVSPHFIFIMEKIKDKECIEEKLPN